MIKTKVGILNPGRKDIIEIASDFANDSLLEKSGNNNYKIVLPLCLNIGNLKTISNFDVRYLKKYKKYNYSPFEDGLIFTKKFKEIEKIISQTKLIRVWSSHLDSE